MLRIIISPAKKMNVADDYPVETGRPHFQEQTEKLKEYLRGLDYGTLKEIWKCNDKIAELNWERLRDMDLNRRVTPAVFAYEGIQYQSMAPGVLERDGLDYIGEHLYILSGFYGILRAFDGVVPYRLEMQAKLAWKREGGTVTSLYDYWGDRLYRVLAGQTENMKETAAEAKNTASVPATEEKQPGQLRAGGDKSSGITIINLASKEYSRAIEPWLTPEDRYITCVFGELEDVDESAVTAEAAVTAAEATGVTETAETVVTAEPAKSPVRVKVKATAAKMARGAMVRFMAENRITEPEQLKTFDWMGYRYLAELSDEDTYVFGTYGDRYGKQDGKKGGKRRPSRT